MTVLSEFVGGRYTDDAGTYNSDLHSSACAAAAIAASRRPASGGIVDAELQVRTVEVGSEFADAANGSRLIGLLHFTGFSGTRLRLT